MNASLQLLSEAFELNNIAVGHMAASDPKAALKGLTQSLGMINEFLNQETELVVAVVDHPSKFDMRFIPVPGFNDSNDTFYVYNHAFALSPALCQETSNVGLPTALVLFNLALGLHQQGKVLNCTRRLQKALNLYGQCSSLLDLPETLADNRISPLVSFLQLATSNNQAAILYEQGDYEASTELLEPLWYIYSQIPFFEGNVPPSTDVHSLMASQEPYIQEILLNATILSTPPTTAASA